MAGALADPLAGLHSQARGGIIFKPLSRAERQLMRGARHLPFDQRRVVAHYIVTSRRADYEHNMAFKIREATRLRKQDVVEDENKRQTRYNDYLARQAERKAEEARLKEQQETSMEGPEEEDEMER